MKIYLYQRLLSDDFLLEKISTNEDIVEAFARSDIEQICKKHSFIFGYNSEDPNDNIDDPTIPQIEEWDITNLIHLVLSLLSLLKFEESTLWRYVIYDE